MNKVRFIKSNTVIAIFFLFFGVCVISAFSFSENPKPVVSEVSNPKIAILKSELSWLDFESGYAKAVKENKILLIDVYTDWCGWCKVMDRTTYSNDTIIDLINASYVPVKLNPEKNRTYTFGDKTMSAVELHKWLGYGQTFGYPTTYFLVQPGKTEERYAQVGYLEVAEFAGILEQVKAKKP
jgi:thioredoxin-related protein